MESQHYNLLFPDIELCTEYCGATESIMNEDQVQ